MSREGKLVKNTFILAIGTFFPKLAAFITLPVLTACLTQEEYGNYDLVLTLVSLVLPAATLQIHSAAFRFLIDVKHDNHAKKEIISNIFAFLIPTSVVALVIMYFVLQNQTPLIRGIICLYFMFDILVNANRQIIRGLSRNTDYAVSSFISAFGQVVLIFVLVKWFRKGLFGAIAGMAFAEVIASVYLLIKGKIYKYIDIAEVSLSKLKELLSYSWPMVPNSLSQWVMHASDRLIISYFMGVSANAVFAVAYKVPSILNFAQSTFNMAWQENASIVSKDEDAASYYSMMFDKLYNLVAGFMSVLIGMTPIIFWVLVRGDYDAAYIHIPILYIGIFFYVLSTFWGGILVAFKETKSVGTTTVISAVIHIVIVLSLIGAIGLYAATIATVVSYIVLCILRLKRVEKLIHIEYKWKRIGWICAVLVCQCALCALRVPVIDAVNLVVGIVFGIVLNMDIVKMVINKAKSILARKTNR